MAKATYPFTESTIPATATQPETKAYRPQRAATLTAPNGQSVRLLVILDTGADACVFPISAASLMGLDILNLPKNYTGGVGNDTNLTYYAEVTIDLGDGISFNTKAGFMQGLESIGLGLLGQKGFFEHYNVEFRHKDRTFTIESA